MQNGDGGLPVSVAVNKTLEASEIRDALLSVATSLFANGQTTERTRSEVERLAAALGVKSTVFIRWSDITIIADDQLRGHRFTANVEPIGIDMGRVASTGELVDDFCHHRLDFASLLQGLKEVQSRPPVGFFRFVLLAAAGAAALGVIFGVSEIFPLLLIACSAAIGAAARRWLATVSHNPFIQPLVASLLAGLFGAAAIHLGLSVFARLIVFCPCMVLVPGPHLLNGAIDLVRARITLGVSRLVYANIIVLSICIGLLGGLAFGDVHLPGAGPVPPVLLWRDVVAAGVAVAAYGTFFDLP
ncbi:threonine/serine exporter family protein [Bradyrhizobium canariense]|uniref:threonine/serine exporter family protein n=1 Tax=Bradyrhizobium canariense TaxID=255045 RepID=UPI000A8365E5|nr:threonine/serine exporter family protein [Bradyrhizobium canariense]